MQLSDLIERVGHLTGPSAEADWLVAAHLGDVPEHSIREIGWDYDWYRRPNEFTLWRAKDSEGRSVEYWSAPRVTASLDAAVAFTERLLPGWTIAGIGQDDRKGWHAELREGFRTSYSTVKLAGAPRPAIALVLATLRAVASTRKEKEDG